MMMVKKYTPNYTKCLVICHGLCEQILVQNMKSNLRLPLEIYSKNNGASSIQITSLLKVLNEAGFKSKNGFLNINNCNIEEKSKKFINFKVFIIMDTDDCDSEKVDNFLNKSMFKNHWLYDYIVPIYNNINLDDVMTSLGYQINKNDKTGCYKKIFPGNNGDKEAFIEIKNLFKNCKKSNLIELLTYLEQYI